MRCCAMRRGGGGRSLGRWRRVKGGAREYLALNGDVLRGLEAQERATQDKQLTDSTNHIVTVSRPVRSALLSLCRESDTWF